MLKRFRSISCLTLSLCMFIILLLLNYLSVSSQNFSLSGKVLFLQKQLQQAEDQGRESESDLLEKEALAMAQNLHHNEGNINKMNNKLRGNKLGRGQLADVNPAAVRVIKKETLGMTFHKDKFGHYLPILPQGNPLLPRGRPEHSVMDIIKAN